MEISDFLVCRGLEFQVDLPKIVIHLFWIRSISDSSNYLAYLQSVVWFLDSTLKFDTNSICLIQLRETEVILLLLLCHEYTRSEKQHIIGLAIQFQSILCVGIPNLLYQNLEIHSKICSLFLSLTNQHIYDCLSLQSSNLYKTYICFSISSWNIWWTLQNILFLQQLIEIEFASFFFSHDYEWGHMPFLRFLQLLILFNCV